MKTVLLSTSACWNCGDDWIREGLLEALQLRPDVRQLWWNRGWGIRNEYQNSLLVNLPLVNYVIMAGTPEWIDKNEDLLRYCIRKRIRIAFLGIGRTGGYIPERHDKLVRDLVDSGLVEIAIPRDQIAHNLLCHMGFHPTLPLSDPALFLPPLPAMPDGQVAGERLRDLSIVCWRGIGKASAVGSFDVPIRGNRKLMSAVLVKAYKALPSPKMVVVHENREVRPAEELFGEKVFFSSDPKELFRFYSRCRYFVGTRIHGWVAAAIHGAPGYLLYPSPKAAVVETIIKRLGWQKSGVVEYLATREFRPVLNLEPPDTSGILEEQRIFRSRCLEAPGLRELMP